ncbi:hypothetical protein HanIR_Chr15g0773691 [Helianthus annuus]|nr:hypothetical protein HanIR_Chr15g0773691 [Helianthus annuus]
MVGGIVNYRRIFISAPNFSLESNSVKHVSFFLSVHIKPENTLTSPHLRSLLRNRSPITYHHLFYHHHRRRRRPPLRLPTVHHHRVPSFSLNLYTTGRVPLPNDNHRPPRSSPSVTSKKRPTTNIFYLLRVTD